MFPRKWRLQRADFSKRPVKRAPFPFGAIVIFATPKAKAAVVVSKKVSKSAVMRNTVRRRFYAALRPLFPRVAQSISIIVYPNAVSARAPFREIEKELHKVVARLT